MLNIKGLTERFFIYETGHASSILAQCFPSEHNDVYEILNNFQLRRSSIVADGGRKTDIAEQIDSFLYNRGWIEKRFDIKITVDGNPKDIPTHKVDCFKNRIALEVEWNNKDPFYDRDLNNFRLLHQMDVISMGIIITRTWELQEIFKKLGIGSSYGRSTTHHEKLMPKLLSGGAGGCPVLVLGIKPSCYVED